MSSTFKGLANLKKQCSFFDPILISRSVFFYQFSYFAFSYLEYSRASNSKHRAKWRQERQASKADCKNMRGEDTHLTFIIWKDGSIYNLYMLRWALHIGLISGKKMAVLLMILSFGFEVNGNLALVLNQCNYFSLFSLLCTY